VPYFLRAGSSPKDETRLPVFGICRGSASAANRARSGAAGRAHAKLQIEGFRWEDKLKVEEHTQGVGAIITNLAALETVLRYFMSRVKNEKPEFPKAGDKRVKKSYLTRSIALQNLIQNYNGVLKATEGGYSIDKRDIVRIRNAFAHGRILTTTEIPARLWNFIGSKKGYMEIEFDDELNAEWLKATWVRIDKDRQKVVDCFKARGYIGLR
jgi:hypothetical protein